MSLAVFIGLSAIFIGVLYYFVFIKSANVNKVLETEADQADEEPQIRNNNRGGAA